MKSLACSLYLLALGAIALFVIVHPLLQAASAAIAGLPR